MDFENDFNNDMKNNPDEQDPGAPVWYVGLLQVHANENAWHRKAVGNCADDPVEPEEDTSHTGVWCWSQESKQWLV